MCKIFIIVLRSDSTIEYTPLLLVQIYYDTATFDEISRDKKITTAIGLIGGTMGLLPGLSILSGVESIYFVAKLFLSLRFRRVEQEAL